MSGHIHEAGNTAPSSDTPLHEQLLSKPEKAQSNSALFTKLPAEVRSYVFAHALADYEDPSEDQQYPKDSCWTRPSYSARRRTDTALLQTCRAVYRETWFLPFLLKEQTHWVTGGDRAPDYYDFNAAAIILRRTSAAICRQHSQPTVAIDSLRIFTQMYMIEDGRVTRFLSSARRLQFRRLTITIRHADWWFWEDDEPLRFDGGWIPYLCSELPPTVREVVIEMETVLRKQRQLDALANEMTQQWHFRVGEETRLFADATPNSREVTRWQGTSAWHNKRWVRDETSPGVIDYYVGAVRFRPQHEVERAGGKISDEALRSAEATSVHRCGNLTLNLPDDEKMDMDEPFIRVQTDDGHGTDLDTSSDWSENSEDDSGEDEEEDEEWEGDDNEESEEENTEGENEEAHQGHS